MITLLQDSPSSLPMKFDLVIVGTGASGISLALSLMKSGLKIGIFEGGLLDRSVWSQSLYRGDLRMSESQSYPPLDEWRLRYFGGTTNHWGGWCRPMEKNVFRARPGVADTAWPFDQSHLVPFYQQAHSICQLGRYEYDSKALCRAAGVAEPFQESEIIKPAVWRYSKPTRFGLEYRSLLENSDIRIFLDANLSELHFRDDSISGASFTTSGRVRRRIETTKLVLACGGIENTRQLLLAEKNGMPQLRRSGLLGSGFMEHPHQIVGQVLDLAPGTDSPDPLIAAFWYPHDEDGTPFRVGTTLTEDALRALRISNVSFTLDKPSYEGESTSGSAVKHLWGAISGGSTRVLDIFARSEQLPNRNSRISLSKDTDPLGLARVQLDWRLSADDLRAIEIAWDATSRELLRMGFGPTRTIPVEQRNPVEGGAHHMGGTTMHESPEHGVVDENMMVHGVHGLYVSGSSVFPTGCFSNPTLTIVALAIRLGQHLIDAW